MIGTTGLVADDPALADEDRLDEPYEVDEGTDRGWPIDDVPERTLCSQCDNVHPETRQKSLWQWRCMKHPRVPRLGWLVEDGYEDNDPRWLRCNDVNGGMCPLFEPKREPPE